MASTIKLKNGSGAPLAGDLVQAEPALDLTNKRLYTEDSLGNVIEVGINPSSLTIGGTALTATAAELNTLDGITATTAELNTLDGITATVTELNYTDGVTSNIQTQLNTKAPIASPTFTGTVTAPAVNVNGTVTADGLTVDASLATIASAGPNVDLVLTEGNTNTDARIRNSNGILEIDADLNNEFGNSSIMFAVDGTDKLKIANNGDISFYEDTGTTAKFFWDASTEFLGIGTTPSRALHAKSGQAVVATVESTSTSNARLAFVDANTTDDTRIGIGSAGNNLLLFTNNTERLRIDSSGNVGIGTTSPSFTLDVNGTFATSGGVFLHDATSSASNAVEVGRGRSVDGAVYIDFTAAAGSSDFDFRMIRGSGTNGDAEFRNKGTGSILFKINGFTEAARIDSSGNLLVGKTSASLGTAGAELKPAGIVRATRDGYVAEFNRITTDGEVVQFMAAGVTRGVIGVDSTRLYISGGDTGVRFVNDDMRPTTGSTTSSDTDGTKDLGDATSRWKNLYLSSRVYTGTTATTSGNLFVHVNGNADGVSTGYKLMSGVAVDTSASHFAFINPNGVVGTISTNGSATAYNTSSDYRLKENVVPMDNASDRVLALNPVRFNFIADPNKTVDGFIAHEAQEVVPEAVHGVKDEVDDEGNPVYQGIDQSKLVPLLTKALQEALERIAVLESKVGA